MTHDDFAHRLAELIGDAEDAGLSHEDLIEALESAAVGLRDSVSE